MSEMPFDGVRVVDFTHEWAGPIGTRIMADFGAEVIKVEYVRRLCVVRGATVADRKYNKHPMWHQVNRNKLSVTLDLNVPKEAEMFRDLVRVADIVVNNSRGGVMERLGFDYENLKKIKPDIILASLSGFGATGPYAPYAGFGGTIEPLGGLMQLTDYERGGKGVRVREMDVLNGLVGACALMTALYHRQQTGEGQWVDLSQSEAATHCMMGEHLLEYVMNGEHTLPLGNRHARFAPQGCYRCAGDDKWVTLTVRTEDQWRALCETIGRLDWLSDPRFGSHSARMENHDEIDRAIEQWTGSRSHYDSMRILQEAGIAAGAVLDTDDLSKDPHLNERGFFIRAEDGRDGLFPGMQFRLSRGAGRLRRRGPDLGEDNERIIGGLLGRGDEDIPAVNEDEIGTSYDPD